MKKPPVTVGQSINKVEELYNAIDGRLARDIPPGMAIKLFQLEQRLDDVVKKLEQQLQSLEN